MSSLSKVWIVAWREFYFNLRRPAFLFAAFGTPAIIIGAVLLGAASGDDGATRLADYGAIGYVDASAEAVLSPGVIPDGLGEAFVAYPDEAAARAALDDGTLAAYFALPANYMASGRVNIYSDDDVPERVEEAIETLLVANLSAGIEADLPAARLANPVGESTVLLADSGRVVDEGGVVFLLLLPFMFALLLLISSLTTSGFLMSGLVEEKTNRIIEVLVSSASPMQLLGGKIVGLFALGLLQVIVLLGFGFGTLAVAQRLDFLTGIVIPADLVILGVIYYLLSYFMLAGLMAGVGAVAGSEQESRQISAFITLPFMLPLFFLTSFLLDPNGSLAVIFSLIPFTAPMAVLLRIGITAVPAWQVIASLLIMTLTALLITWLAARVFRWGLLAYGKKIAPLRALRAVLRRGEPASTPQPEERSAR
jgi:ABC-2 type transport system permease protein